MKRKYFASCLTGILLSFPSASASKIHVQTYNSSLIAKLGGESRVISKEDFLAHITHAFQIKPWFYENEYEERMIPRAKSKHIQNVKEIIYKRYLSQMKKIDQFVEFYGASHVVKSKRSSKEMQTLKNNRVRFSPSGLDAQLIDNVNASIRSILIDLFRSSNSLVLKESGNLAFKVVRSYFNKAINLEFVSIKYRRPFEMQKTEISQKQWHEMLGYNPSFFSERHFCHDSFEENNDIKVCPNLPVETISIEQVHDFITRLNAMDKKYTYSLPSAEEWSFAADSKYLPDIDEYAWHYDNSRLQTHTVGVRRPNKWGLYDMLGNVFEFVAPSPPLQGEKKSQAMNARGGAWLNTLDMIGPRENWQIDIYHSCFDLGARVIRRPR